MITDIINRFKELSSDKKNSNANIPTDAVDESINNENKDINQEELVAVIAAAVASSLGVGIPDINIRTIRRIPQGTSPWSDMGRKEQLLGKL